MMRLSLCNLYNLNILPVLTCPYPTSPKLVARGGRMGPPLEHSQGPIIAEFYIMFYIMFHTLQIGTGPRSTRSPHLISYSIAFTLSTHNNSLYKGGNWTIPMIKGLHLVLKRFGNSVA